MMLLDPAFRFESTLRMTLRIGGDETRQIFAQVDHFAGQIAYFSDCIATGRPPEADGAEGLADMRALLAIDAAARSGRTVLLDSKPFGRGISNDMRRSFPVTARRLLVSSG